MARTKTVGKRLQRKAKQVSVLSCQDIKDAITKELRTQVKDKELVSRLVDALGSEVAYGTGGGGGVGVA
jgi:hypothetical protein